LKKLYFVLPSLRAGGAERVISYLASNLNKSEFDVTLIIVGKEKDAAYNVKDIPVFFLNKDRVLEGAFPLLKIIARSRPDIVMSSIGHLNVLLGCFSILFPKTKFVGREASVISVFNKYSNKKSLFNKKSLYRFGYKRMDIIVCQSRDMFLDFKKTYGMSDDQMVVIPNPAPDNMKLSIAKNDFPSPLRLITIGRLSPEKGHLRILESLAKVEFDFEYTIIGSGAEEERIKNKINELNLTGQINFISFTNKINEELIEHDYFLQGSYVEGFPNALIESCVSGTPVLAFNAPGGTKEIIENGVNGFIVENENDFVAQLNRMVNLKWDPEVIRESVYKKFKSKIVLDKYEHMFKQLVREK
tara:strand:+ start:14897 stop:15970 length:1074 start_codon:yes stop_codon:yes gene_type:complete